MNRIIRYLIIGALLVIAYFYFFNRKPTMIYALTDVKTSQDAIAIFPTSIGQISSMTDAALKKAQNGLDAILAIPNDQRTYENTVAALDRLASYSNLSVAANLMQSIDLVYTDEKIKDAARNELIKIQAFYIDNIASNRALYQALKYYAEHNASKEELTDVQKKYLSELLRDYKNAGLDLPDDQLEEVKTIKKDLASIGLQFDKNIAEVQSKLEVDESALTGLSESFIKSLKKTEDGKYILGVDYPTYIQVMDNCSNAQTRKDLWALFVNRAYPVNKKVLEDMIARRYELAHKLGFPNYATFEISTEMAENPARVQKFLQDIHTKAEKKAKIEFKEFTYELPESVQLTKDGKIYPWDSAYVRNQYKKARLSLDDNKVAEYFPMQHTVDALLDIYQKFFDLEFKQIPASGLWHPDVQMIEVYDKTNNTKIGYLFLDLFPRPLKYSHACQQTIIPVIFDTDGKLNQGVALVVANFPKPRADQPSLLQFKDVNTFFHEFGHAMHALLGRTSIASFTGTNVKHDFVEMPSQMLEEWLWSPEILKNISYHYKTGQPLPDELINTILKTRNFDSGFHISRQLMLANLSLDCFNAQAQVNLDELYKSLFKKFVISTQFEPKDHFYTAFGHLGGYGARYYGYLWSSVFAHDLASEVKKANGYTDPVVGRRYVDAVIGKGGSQDPNLMLKNFLGREPNQDAFLKDMGFE